MKGKYRIIIENKKIKYDFEVKRNFTIIKGDSATGKTTLVDMISEYYNNGNDSGIHLQCSRTCAVLEGRDWKTLLTTFNDSILFIDEGNSFLGTLEFASLIQKTDNYYVIVTREALPALPYSVTEIYGIRDSKRYGLLKQTYNEMYHIYGNIDQSGQVNPDIVITEDSGSGFQFFDNVCKESKISCLSAFGKSNIFHKVCQQSNAEAVLVVADGAAFGSEMEKLMSLVRIRKKLYLYLPESFEWLVLCTGIIRDSELEQILSETYNYVESSKYASWEQYFTTVLIEKTKDTYMAYSKSKLNKAYAGRNVTNHILKQIKGICFVNGVRNN